MRIDWRRSEDLEVFCRMCLILFIGFFSFSVFAEGLPDFSASSWVEETGNFMLTDIAKKLRELGATYPKRTLGKSQNGFQGGKYFYASKTAACGSSYMTGLVAKVTFSAVTANYVLTQRISYGACSLDQLEFVELLQTRGGDQVPLTEGEILSGRRKFTLQGLENFRKYAILDGNQSEIFAFTTRRIGTGRWETVISFKEMTLAYINVKMTAEGEKVEIQKLPKGVIDQISKGSIILTDDSSLHMGIHVFRGNQIYTNLRTTYEMSFKSMMDDLTTVFRNSLGVNLFKKLITMLLSDFPKSEAPPSVSKIKNELTVLLAQVLSNPSGKEIPKLVQDLINILLNAINAGLIIDTRPL